MYYNICGDKRMDIIINNTSRTDAYLKTEENKHFKRLKAGSSTCISVQNTAVRLFVKPGDNTVYSNMMSKFVILSEYSFHASNNMTLTLSFETAKADIDGAFHDFRRVSLKGFDRPYHVSFSVIPPDKIRNGVSSFFWESLTNLFVGAGLPVLFGLIAWANTDSAPKGLITAAVTLVVFTVITSGTEKIFDKLHNKRRKRKGLPNDKEPIGLSRCLDPGYIDCVFKKAGF